MLPRHSNECLSRLDRAYRTGCAVILWSELLMWYNQDRMSVGIWRDLQEKFEEIKEYSGEKDDADSRLIVGQTPEFITLVWAHKLKIEEDCWYKELNDLAKRKSLEEA
jgi:hypothetical protein